MTASDFWSFFKIIAKRFLKAFVAGGLAGLAMQLTTSPVPVTADIGQLKTWGITLGVAFIAGALMAIEKAIQGYTPPTT
jgi:hypothetical protein